MAWRMTWCMEHDRVYRYADLETAQDVCDHIVQCFGVTKDANGFEPRRKGLGLRPWPGMATWVKQYTKKDCPKTITAESLVANRTLQV